MPVLNRVGVRVPPLAHLSYEAFRPERLDLADTQARLTGETRSGIPLVAFSLRRLENSRTPRSPRRVTAGAASHFHPLASRLPTPLPAKRALNFLAV